MFAQLRLVKKAMLVVGTGLLLISCVSNGDRDQPESGVVDGRLKTFVNSEGESHERPPIRETLDYLVKLYTNRFPDKSKLPRNHVLDPSLAAQQFVQSRRHPYALTWFGHSTFLVKMGTINVLTDPVFGDSVGPFPFKVHRMVPVLPNWRDISYLDAIVISHGDYDHLDVATLRKLVRQFPKVRILVPQGAAPLLKGLKKGNVVELAWYHSVDVGLLKIYSVPAVHSTQRPPHKTDSIHWSGFILKDKRRSVYFSGDTGEGRVFKEIRRRIGPVNLAIVPTGAYAPQDYEKSFHVTPEAAVKIAQTLGAPLAVGMHWGTFALSQETGVEQKRRFLNAAKASVQTTVFRIGESRKLP